MKKFIITSILLVLFAGGSTLVAQNNNEEKLGLPGDNLNLYAVMKLFQESKTLEEFEKNLNDPNSNINNLDLNGDNLVDYIKVIDNVDGDVHNIVLQDAISPKENQDVAVFTVQRFQNGQVQIQLTGDEQLYGKDYIIEPIYDDANSGGTPNPGYSGNTRVINGQTVTYVNTSPVQIAAWPLVRFIFLPSYVIWRSSWYWGYYPGYWHPWHTYSWDYYYGYQYNWNHYYYRHYRQWNYHRYSRWNDFYYNGRRSYSPDIHHRIEMGYYKTTYSHPDQRKDGEAMFAKAYPEQYRRSSAVSSRNNSNVTRRTNTTTNNKSITNPHSDNNPELNRRSSTVTTSKPVTNKPSGNNPELNRRSTTVTTSKPVTNKPSGNNPELNRRSTTVTTSKSVTDKPSGDNAGINRRTTTKVTDKPVINHPSGQNAGTNSVQKQTKGPVVNSNRKNINKTKSATPIKKDNKVKETENKESDHNKE
ncbi:MAG: hypothetical protein WA816_01365 [Bacteroidales bacterium]